MRAVLKCVFVVPRDLLWSERARGQEIAVAAAADLKFAMGELAANFEKQTGNKVNVTYGSSGNFSRRYKMERLSTCFFRRMWSTRRNWKRAG